MPEAATGPLRRRPVQRRSAERVERILDAVAALLDEVGYDALTTTAAARRAGVPIGTLYQFFDGKAALARALAERNFDVLIERLRERLSGRPAASWPDAASLVVREFVAMKREVPGFAVVDFGDARAGRHDLLEGTGGAENNEVVARRLGEFAVKDLGLPDSPDLPAVLLAAVEALDGLLRLAFRAVPGGDERLIAEADTMVRAYFAARLP